MASFLAVAAIICVLITAVATIVAFSTPNWIKIVTDVKLCNCMNCDCGLWLFCTSGSLSNNGDLGNCEWFFARDYFIERSLPDWFKAVQGLMSCAIATSLLALLVGLFSLCCKCKSCNPYQAAGAFINLTFLLIAVSVCVFGAKAYMDHGAVVLSTDSLQPKCIYGWSFLGCCGGCSDGSYYKHPSTFVLVVKRILTSRTEMASASGKGMKENKMNKELQLFSRN